jgi:hypothetical protein
MKAMAQFGASPGARRQGSASSSTSRAQPMSQVADPYPLFGEETGLPMIQCTYCKRARMIEWRMQQDSPNNYGRIYIKCPRNENGLAFRFYFDFYFDL